MSALEQSFCRSAPWRGFARTVVLPWAMHGTVPAGHLLELGSGSGAMAEGTAISHPDLQLTVTDIDPVMVHTARGRLARFPSITVTEADATELPFPDGTFDVVASYLMLHHVIDWQRALREAARVLKPDGLVVGYDLSRTRLAELVHVVDRSPHHLIDKHELAPALDDAGLTDIRVGSAFAGHVLTFTARAPR